MDIKTLYEKVREIRPQIKRILDESTYFDYDDLSGLQINYKDSEEVFLLDELRRVMDKLADVQERLDYLARPVREVSKLHRNQSGRYETAKGREYTSGCRIEALVQEEYRNASFWTRTSVEHDGNDYFLVGYKDIPLDGLQVRVRK